MHAREMKLAVFEKDEDWVGNNAAFACPLPDCGKVYIVSALIHKEGRECPACGQSRGFVSNTQSKGGKAWIAWP